MAIERHFVSHGGVISIFFSGTAYEVQFSRKGMHTGGSSRHGSMSDHHDGRHVVFDSSSLAARLDLESQSGCRLDGEDPASTLQTARTTKPESLMQTTELSNWKSSLLFLMSIFNGFNKNVSHAKTMGMDAYLFITHDQWSVLLMDYYIGYFLGMLIIVLFCRNCGPSSAFLCQVVIMSGVCTMSNAFADFLPRHQRWIWISMTRYFQGMFEALFSILLIAYISRHHGKSELASFMPLHLMVPAVSSCLGAIYARGMVEIQIAAFASWQLHFIIWGGSSIIIGIICFLSLNKSSYSPEVQNSEVTEKNLSLQQKSISLRRLFVHPIALIWMVSSFISGISANILLLFMPQMFAKAGFSLKDSNLLPTFAYLTALLSLILLLSRAAAYDRIHAMIALYSCQLSGFLMYRTSLALRDSFMAQEIQLASLLMAAGIGSQTVLAAKEYGSRFRDEGELLAVNTVVVGFFNLGGVLMSWTFRVDHFLAENLACGLVSLGFALSLVHYRYRKEIATFGTDS